MSSAVRRRTRFGPLPALLASLYAFVFAGSEASCEPVRAERAAWFEEVAEAVGIDFVHVRAVEPRMWFPEIMSGGAAWLDYDGDGDPDLYLVQGGHLGPGPEREVPSNKLYRNDGEAGFVDVTTWAGVGDTSYGMGVAAADYDGDGNVDLYVTNVGRNRLYRNLGDGTFEDATDSSGVGDDAWGASAAFLDYDEDGDLDLFVVNYVVWTPESDITCFGAGGRRDYCHPLDYQAPAADRLYRNEGGGRFSDVTAAAGIATGSGHGLGVAAADLDLDGRLDVYVANDGMPNHHWKNNGDGTFSDISLISGTAVNMAGMEEAGMGVSVVDIDNDGKPDIFLTHLRQETNTLYLNRGGFFEDATLRFGFSAASIPRTSFGAGFADFDHDGRLDLYVANGRVVLAEAPDSREDPFAQPDQLFQGLASGAFAEVAPNRVAGAGTAAAGRAAAFADFDGDGGLDIAVVNNGGKLQLLRNLAAADGAWIGFRFAGPESAALGRRVRLKAGNGVQWRQVQRAYSYCASNEPVSRFGLGTAREVDEILLTGRAKGDVRYLSLPAGKLYVVAEDTSQAPK